MSLKASEFTSTNSTLSLSRCVVQLLDVAGLLVIAVPAIVWVGVGVGVEACEGILRAREALSKATDRDECPTNGPSNIIPCIVIAALLVIGVVVGTAAGIDRVAEVLDGAEESEEQEHEERGDDESEVLVGGAVLEGIPCIIIAAWVGA